MPVMGGSMSKFGFGRVTIAVITGFLVLPAVGVNVAGAAPVRAGAAAAPAGPLSAADVASASALAAATGQPAEILADRTDFSQTFAEPGGGFETTESLVPQRVQQPDGSWVPVDTALSAQPDGSVAPAAILTGLALSGGGAGPLLTLSQGGRSLAVSSPFGTLPAPAVAGSTATYADVLPGVNLLVSATPTGVSEVIEVMSAAAAANPALDLLRFPVSGSGLSVSADGAGGLAAADGQGRVVFSAPAPQMWDSAGPQGPGGGSVTAACSSPLFRRGRRGRCQVITW